MTVRSCDHKAPIEDNFTPAVTRPIVQDACRLVGLDATDAVLLRHQTNGVYQLVTAPVVVKVARPGISHLRHIVALVHWLREQDVPTVPLLEHVDQPLSVGGYEVTLWQYLPQTRPILAGDIAEPLVALHRLPPPPMTLPTLDALAAIHHSIDRGHILTAEERVILHGRWERLNELVPWLSYGQPPRLLHSDPQHRNTLWDDQANHPVLCDWEGAVIGPVEWDLVTIEIHCRRFGRPEHEYRDFSERYGADIRRWPGYPVFRDLRELRMIASNARKSPAHSRAALEVHRRIARLGAGPTEQWKIL
jgi:Phosphotransferase enzyme family